jgi:hypothetical protein
LAISCSIMVMICGMCAVTSGSMSGGTTPSAAMSSR